MQRTYHNIVRALSLPAFLAGTLVASTTNAGVVAYLRFEEGEANTTVVPQPGANAVVDSAGGDDNFAAYATANAPTYRTDVPFAAVPQTGEANLLSLDTAGNKDVYSIVNGPLRTTDFNAFTIETFVKFAGVTGFQTMVGRDDTGNPGQGTGPNSLLYLQKSNTNFFRFEAPNEANQLVSILGTTPVVAGQWYHVAVVGDGTNATLYVNGQTQGTVAFAGGMYDPAGDTIWTVGRGQYAGATGDFVNGLIDEVRISDTALAPSEFLNAVPEPTSVALLGLGALGLLARRRRAL